MNSHLFNSYVRPICSNSGFILCFRSSKSDLMAKEIEGGARAKCKQRKPKPPVKKESSAVSHSDHGSKRIDDVKL